MAAIAAAIGVTIVPMPPVEALTKKDGMAGSDAAAGGETIFMAAAAPSFRVGSYAARFFDKARHSTIIFFVANTKAFIAYDIRNVIF